MRARGTIQAILTAALLTGGIALSQEVNAPHKYEVAAIHPSKADAAGPPFDMSPSGAININTTASMLIQMAYSVKEYQVVGAPKWIATDYFRVVGKPPGGTPPVNPPESQKLTSERLRYLLEERFQLTTHRETRNMKEYVLVVGKGGFKLPEVERHPEQFRLNIGKGGITTRGGAKVAMLASVLGNILSYPVTDQTGLNGYYDIQLKYSPDETDREAAIFSAVEQQLGLKLVGKTGPLEVLVVDRIEHPADN